MVDSVILVAEKFGLIAVVCAAAFWFINKQNQFIQNDLSKDIHKKFNRLEDIINNDLRNIIIGLINAQKKHTVDLKGINKSYESIVHIITKLSCNGLKDKFRKNRRDYE